MNRIMLLAVSAIVGISVTVIPVTVAKHIFSSGSCGTPEYVEPMRQTALYAEASHLSTETPTEAEAVTPYSDDVGSFSLSVAADRLTAPHTGAKVFASAGNSANNTFIYFSNEPQTPLPQDKKDKIFQNFMITLYRYYRQERDVTFYADKQCLSARYFSSVIKEKSGSSALQWIIQNVITEAKYLLDNTDLSIKEITTKLNFPTQSFYGKYFKQYVGISPKEYRNKLIKQ